MRRKDRQVTAFNRIVSIIDECPIIHIALADEPYPYVVTVNFAYKVEGEQVYFYIHGAKAGRKYELMQKNKKCGFFMEVNEGIKVMPEKKDCRDRIYGRRRRVRGRQGRHGPLSGDGDRALQSGIRSPHLLCAFKGRGAQRQGQSRQAGHRIG